MRQQFYVYMLASKYNGTLYIGVTKKYQVHQLVWYEVTDNALAAITREKQLKKWNRAWKIRLIEKANPEWKDLYAEIT